jgi:hypothetical protein
MTWQKPTVLGAGTGFQAGIGPIRNLHEIFMNYPDFIHGFFYKLISFGRTKPDGT